jgi:hypothetical protein
MDAYMPEISQKLISLFSHGILSGISVCVIAFVWWRLSRGFQKCPKPPIGLLIAVAFLVLEVIFRPSSFNPRFGPLLFMVLLALWLSRSIFYWRELRYAMLCLSMAGIFLTVPDTENVILLVGILVPTTLFVWPLNRIGSETPANAAGLGAVVAWVICLAGQGRPASILVSLGCLGLLMIVPLLQMFRKSRVFLMNRFRLIPLLLHALSISVAVGLARTTERLDTAATAAFVALAIPILAVMLIAKTYYREVQGDQIIHGKHK